MGVSQSIYVTGFMGSGKTTIGTHLSEKLNLPFIDLDNYVESKTGKTIAHLFNSGGESIFRKIEHSCLQEVLSKPTPHVVALGGGTVCYLNTVSMIKNNGTLIYLKADIKTLYNRLLPEISSRPLLQGLQPNELEDFIASKISERETYYSQAQIQVDANGSVETVTEKIITSLPQ